MAMTNLDHQRPGDLWMLDKVSYEVNFVERSADRVVLECRRRDDNTLAELTISLVRR